MSDISCAADRSRRFREFMGLRFADVTLEQAAAELQLASKRSNWTYVVTPNAANMARVSRNDAALTQLYQKAHLCLLDSRVIALAAWLAGVRAPRVVPGADLVRKLFETRITAATRVCIVGGLPNATALLKSRFHLGRIAHVNPSMGFWRSQEEIEQVASFIVQSAADYTFLVVGSPGQEILAARVAAMGTGRGIGICAGASIDFLTGARRRAPRVLQHLALEWAFRLCCEPRRLAHRYLVESPRGIWMIFRAMGTSANT